MAKRTYRAAVYARFNGLYHCVRWEDFGERGGNLQPEELADAERLLTVQL